MVRSGSAPPGVTAWSHRRSEPACLSPCPLTEANLQPPLKRRVLDTNDRLAWQKPLVTTGRERQREEGSLAFWVSGCFSINQCQVFNLRSDSSVQTVKAMGGRYRGPRTAHLQSLYSLPTTPGPPYNLRASPQSNKTARIHRCHPPNCMPPATRRPTDYIRGVIL